MLNWLGLNFQHGIYLPPTFIDVSAKSDDRRKLDILAAQLLWNFKPLRQSRLEASYLAVPLLDTPIEDLLRFAIPYEFGAFELTAAIYRGRLIPLLTNQRRNMEITKFCNVNSGIPGALQSLPIDHLRYFITTFSHTWECVRSGGKCCECRKEVNNFGDLKSIRVYSTSSE